MIADKDPLLGTTLGGNYEVEQLIGVGAMGRVYRARHRRLVNKRYALKVLYGELTASAVMRMRFAHEAESASKLDHPNIVGVLDFGCTDAGLMYLVMDLVTGPTLSVVVEQGPMSPARTIRLARQLCEGLAQAHARGIVHRDFKPDNILVAGEPGAETLRIADFGLAISVSGDDARLTTSGVLCTPTYAAPEQLLGKHIDHRADLYALGVTIYEMLTGGVLPFKKSTQDVMLWKVTTEWPAVSERAPHVPTKLAQLVRRLLARDPDGRPASAREVISVLDGITGALDIIAPPKRIRRRTILGAGLSAVGASCVLAGVLAHWTAGVEPSVAADLDPVSTASEEITPVEIAPSVMRELMIAAPPEEELAEPVDLPPLKAVPLKPARVRLLTLRRPPPVARTATAEPPPVALPRSEPPPPAAAVTPAVAVVVAPPKAPEPVVAARMPTPAPAKPIVRPPPPPPARVIVPARAPRIVDIEVSGAFPPSVVRRAVERVLPALKRCSDVVGTRVVKASFAIEETRRAASVRIGGAGAACVAAELASVRTEVAPDVGEVSVVVRLAFGS